MTAYAVIKTGGKQYRVAENDLIVVEKLLGDAGDSVVFDDVLMRVNGGDVEVGAPLIANASVAGEIAEQRRADKIRIVKKKARTNDRKTMGHRQHETVVRITSLTGDASAKPKKQTKPKAAPETKQEAPAAQSAPKSSDAPAQSETPTIRFLDAPEGEADDLKKIGGVGPVIERKLNDLGIYHFHQIAEFSAEDVARVDDVLNFKGRIERENWQDQAAKLARGEDPNTDAAGED